MLAEAGKTEAEGGYWTRLTKDQIPPLQEMLPIPDAATTTERLTMESIDHRVSLLKAISEEKERQGDSDSALECSEKIHYLFIIRYSLYHKIIQV